MNYVEIILRFLSSLGAVALALAGSHFLQYRIGRRHQDADTIRHHLYELLELAADYWVAGDPDYKSRQGLEARIIATQSVISCEVEMAANHTRRLRRWHEETKPSRLNLIDAVTGDCFQQRENWHQNPSRFTHAAKEISSILQSLHHAC